MDGKRAKHRHLDYLIELATLENTLLALLPIVVTAVRHTTMINDSITAYSTAVGPSSEAKKRRNFRASDFMWLNLHSRDRLVRRAIRDDKVDDGTSGPLPCTTLLYSKTYAGLLECQMGFFFDPTASAAIVPRMAIGVRLKPLTNDQLATTVVIVANKIAPSLHAGDDHRNTSGTARRVRS